jgi:hypothetical protein
MAEAPEIPRGLELPIAPPRRLIGATTHARASHPNFDIRVAVLVRTQPSSHNEFGPVVTPACAAGATSQLTILQQ